ncbi:MAG TPA: AAA family ATPase, partial [Flavobacterium sp.]
STVLIEEPEHGLHPWAVKELISHIRSVVDLKHLQVILTTHSQQVLENIEKSELLITERDQNGTRYNTIDFIIPDADISMGEIGELWTRGLLRGVPTSF